MKVLIVDDHRIVLSGWSALLSGEPDIEVFTAVDGAAALAARREIDADLFIIDVSLPDMSGFDLMRQIVGEAPDARIIVFALSDDPIVAMEAFGCGAAGFIGKNDDATQFISAIRKVAGGGKWLPDAVAEQIALFRSGAAGSFHHLTEREFRVLRLLAHGQSMNEVAGELNVSYKTVTNDCNSIRSKLGARTPLEMIRLAMQLKLI